MKIDDIKNVSIAEDGRLSLYLGVIPVLFLIFYISFLHVVLANLPEARLIFEPPFLLPILNFVFVFLASCLVSYLAVRAYLISGTFTILMVGCGVLVLGTGSLLGAWVVGPKGPHSPNVSVTIYNLCALMASLFHMAGVFASQRPPDTDPRRRRNKFIAGYCGVLGSLILIALAAPTGMLPTFYIQEVGPTVLRQAVLVAAVFFFTLSSLFIMVRFIRKGARFFYWYSIALLLMAVAMVAFIIQPAVGSPMGWAGRGAQYLSGIYFLLGVLAALREGQRRGLTINVAFADIFLKSGIYWQDILATVSDAIVSCNSRGEILQWNQAAEKIFGYSRVEALGKVIDLILPGPHDLDFKDRGESRIPPAGVVEMNLKKKDGAFISGEVFVSVTKLSIGIVTTLLIRDITGRKRMEESLREGDELHRLTAEKLAKMFHSTPSFHSLTTFAEGRYLEVNPAYERTFGYRKDELIGRTVFELNIWADFKERERLGVQLKERGSISGEEVSVCIKSGEIRTIFLSGESIEIDGQPCIIFSGMDITDLKKAEAELRDSRRKYRDLIETTADFIWEMDSQGRYTYCSPQMEKLWGIKPEEMIGKTPFDMMPPQQKNDAAKLFAELAKSPRPFSRLEFAACDEHSRFIYIEASGVPFFNDDGRLLGFRGISRDITERKEAEEALKKAHSDLEVKVRERTQELQQSKEMLQHLSLQLMSAQEAERKRIAAELHDSICANLATIKLTLEKKLTQMKEGFSPSGIKLEDIISSVQRCNEETRKIMNNLRPGMLDDLGLLPTLNWFFREFQNTNPRLAVQKEILVAEEDLPDTLKIVIYRVMQEALNNVAKHSGADTVSISLLKQGGQIKMLIQDKGRGFDLEKIIVEKSGMGLINMRERVQWSGGSFSLHSNGIQGTSISASWPIPRKLFGPPSGFKREVDQPERSITNFVPSGERALKVLVVEDNKAFCDSFKENLHAVHSYVDIEEVGDGSRCMAKVDSFRPHLIFMDIRLPGENGLSLLKKVKAKYPKTQVIIMTSYDNPEYGEAALKSGASRFYSKDRLDLEEIRKLLSAVSL